MIGCNGDSVVRRETETKFWRMLGGRGINVDE